MKHEVMSQHVTTDIQRVLKQINLDRRRRKNFQTTIKFYCKLLN